MLGLSRSKSGLLWRPLASINDPRAAAVSSFPLNSDLIPNVPIGGQIAVPTEQVLPKRAQVVIAGAGMIGNSVACHLVQNGWKDIVIIDKGGVADGTSKTGSGLLGLFRPSAERAIVKYCIDFYRLLQDKGYDIGLQQSGSLNLACSKDRFVSLTRRASRYQPTGLDCHIVSKAEAKELNPYLTIDDIFGAIWVPEDSEVEPKKVSEVLAYLSYQGGAKFVGNCEVRSVETSSKGGAIRLPGPKSYENCHVTGVDTSLGYIECEYFVNCGGIWARNIGQLSEPKVKVPICPAQHYFLTFKRIDKVVGQRLPTVRDYDNHLYLRKFKDSFLMGIFEPRARPWRHTTGEPETHHPGVEGVPAGLSADQWVHVSPFIHAATNRLNVLKETEYEMLMNTPDAFTPDGRWIIGETPEVANYFVCAGMNGNSLQGAAGVGKAVADWIANGRPSVNCLEFEVARFTSLHNNPRFLMKRTEEVVGRHYQLKYPIVDEFKTARRIRTSSIYSELEARGAVFGERMGWERPLYFMPHHGRDDPPEQLPPMSFGRPQFFEHIEDEYHVCREGVGLIDMSSFAKFLIKGEEAMAYMQKLCCNNVDIAPGGVASAMMLNEMGTFENDCLVLRRNEKSIMMVCPTQQQTRIMEWMEQHLEGFKSVSLQDITSMYTVLTLVGPKAKDLMAEMCETEINMQPFTFRFFNMSYASGVMAVAITQTGEPGYSLYVPTESALHLYDKLMRIGANYGIRNVGLLAMRFLRIERFIPFWGDELNADSNPFETNRGLRVMFGKQDFIGKEAITRIRDQPGTIKKLVQVQIESFDKDKDLWPGGGEALYRNGEFVGCVTNSAYGFTVKKMICLGFVSHPDTFKGRSILIDQSWIKDRKAQWSINIAGTMFPCSVYLNPPKIPQINVDVNKTSSSIKKKAGHIQPTEIAKRVKAKDREKVKIPFYPKTNAST